MKFFSLAFFIGLSAAAAINLRAEDPCRIVKNVTIVSGDTLGAIAEAENTTVAAILSVNPSITSANAIFLDQVVAIPSSECVVEEVPETPAATATCVAAGSVSTYTVVAGDVLTDIAASLGITLDSLVAANPDINPDVLSIDQVLDVPVCDA